MGQTVYVDVLVIINIYINYGLLLLTCFCVKKVPERMKILLSSLFGGIYSLIILVPDIKDCAVSLSRIPALLIMVLLAFGYGSTKEYFRTVVFFFLINLVFAGGMLMLWIFVCPKNMYCNSGVVYFDIDAFNLVLFTAVTYAVIRAISVITKNKMPDSFTYEIKINISGKEFNCKAFYDSGNCLRDPFSGDGVTIVDIDVLKGLVNENVFDNFETMNGRKEMRLIPVKSLAGTGLLPSLRADKINIIGLEHNIILEKPVIALCKEKIHGGEYGALLYSSVFENISKGKGEADVLHT